ncbi:MAG: hypothetical protein LBI42_04395 [Chitinispirillales bacterium]|jgi:hypothetical protein|nr:hypothetical protein [Chitinispirillales bacterium]
MKYRHTPLGGETEARNMNSFKEKEICMHTTFRMKTIVNSPKLEIEMPGLELLAGREVEIIIIADGVIEDGSKPPQGMLNSHHTAGSIILDDEALRHILADRLK